LNPLYARFSIFNAKFLWIPEFAPVWPETLPQNHLRNGPGNIIAQKCAAATFEALQSEPIAGKCILPLTQS
jgi:hypothetical protein